MSALDLDAIGDEFLSQCGSCDAGLPMSCNCTKRDYRPTMLALVREVERIRADSARPRPTIIVQVGSVDVDRLRRWLESPNGALTTDTDMRHLPHRGLTVEAVEGGAVWFRVSNR